MSEALLCYTDMQSSIRLSGDHKVRGVAVLDRNDRLCLLETLDGGDCGQKALTEKALYASVDALDEKIGAALSVTDRDSESFGLYVGQLMAQGCLAVFGLVTSVSRRVLVCVESDGQKEQISDLVMRDILIDIGNLFVEEIVANPFSCSDDSAPVVFGRGQLKSLVETHFPRGERGA
jgi:hypothetical protein